MQAVVEVMRARLGFIGEPVVWGQGDGALGRELDSTGPITTGSVD